MIKFGKSSVDLISQKQNFFSNNDKMLSESQEYGQFYQPRREVCKYCGMTLRRRFYKARN